MSPEIIGQGSFELGIETTQPMHEGAPQNQETRISIASLLKQISDAREVDPGLVTERDVQFLTPEYIESGLYVPAGTQPKDVRHAYGPVIFPAHEYSLLTISPQRLAEKAANGVWSKRRESADKAAVTNIAGRASAHALESQHQRLEGLLQSLENRQQSLQVVTNELFTARGTGYFAHYPANELRIMVANASSAIYEALDVAASTKEWNAEQYARAQRTLDYKLFGDSADRYKNWKAFEPMAQRYIRKRRLVVLSAKQALEKEFKKYQPFLNED